MLRAIVGFVLGFMSGALAILSFVSTTPGTRVSTAIFSVAMLAINIIFAHRHHIKMRNKYYDRLKNGVKEWHI